MAEEKGGKEEWEEIILRRNNDKEAKVTAWVTIIVYGGYLGRGGK